jgi:hypothetical protein
MISFQDKKIFIWIIIGIIILGTGIFAYSYFTTKKTLKLLSPNGKEELRAGKTYQITWKSKKIGKIGIMLIKEDTKETKWIVEDFPAGKQKYDWKIFVWEEPRQDYKIAILEYPWQAGNKIDYSDDKFTILGPHFASCDQLSIESEWPYLPGDFPNLRRVFITESSFNGNLEGLEGADKKCQEEAEKLGLKGTWKAFLGDDSTLAVDRLNLDGIFVQAPGIGILPQEKIPANFWGSFGQFLKTAPPKEKEAMEKSYNYLEKPFSAFLKKWENVQDEKTCYRLLGKNFEEFFKKLSDPLNLNQKRLEGNFLNNLTKIWLGRINRESKRDCTTIFTMYPPLDPSRSYSFTTTCQNWTMGQETVPGYPSKPGEEIKLPQCYTPEGKRINAVGLAGLSSGLIGEKENQSFSSSIGRSCDTAQKLLCVEQ